MASGLGLYCLPVSHKKDASLYGLIACSKNVNIIVKKDRTMEIHHFISLLAYTFLTIFIYISSPCNGSISSSVQVVAVVAQ